MFKFAFDIETDQNQALGEEVPVGQNEDSDVPKLPSESISLEELLKTLPDHISCSPIQAPGASPLLRRDLYDARFQVMTEAEAEFTSSSVHGSDSQTQSKDGSEEAYVDASSDLIPGTYEGGLKTWEGGVDLIRVLSELVGSESAVGSWAVGSRALEVGCGTGLPTAFILRQVLQYLTANETKENRPTILHLQDYNRSVLSLVTLPNLILATLPFLPAASIDYEVEEEPSSSYIEPGTLSLTPELLAAFQDLLRNHQITLMFTSGDWSHFSKTLEKPYDLVLTAETIYAENSVGALLDVLQSACRSDAGRGWEEAMERLKVDGVQSLTERASVVLVAAKVIYFGVGGGIDGFIRSLKERKGHHVTLLDIAKGVKRTVLRIGW